MGTSEFVNSSPKFNRNLPIYLGRCKSQVGKKEIFLFQTHHLGALTWCTSIPEWNCPHSRAYSSSLLYAAIAQNHLPFFKTFSIFVHFCPNFQIFHFSAFFFALFLKNCMHAITFWNRFWLTVLTALHSNEAGEQVFSSICKNKIKFQG